MRLSSGPPFYEVSAWVFRCPSVRFQPPSRATCRIGPTLNRSAKADGAIVVAAKNNNKNRNNKKKKVVVVRPYRAWNKQAYYGTVMGGVALGTILGAAAYSAVAPAPNLCWYRANPARIQGYWDYC